jgi:hypothetical protein
LAGRTDPVPDPALLAAEIASAETASVHSARFPASIRADSQTPAGGS